MGSKKEWSEVDERYISAVAYLFYRMWKNLKAIQDRYDFSHELYVSYAELCAYRMMTVGICTKIISFQAYQKIDSAIDRMNRRLKRLGVKRDMRKAAKETA